MPRGSEPARPAMIFYLPTETKCRAKRCQAVTSNRREPKLDTTSADFNAPGQAPEPERSNPSLNFTVLVPKRTNCKSSCGN